MWIEGKWDGVGEGPAKGRWRKKLKTGLQCVSFPPFAFIPLKGPVCLCPEPKGEQSHCVSFPYLARGRSPCWQLSLRVFELRCKLEPEEACVFICNRKVYSEGGVP